MLPHARHITLARLARLFHGPSARALLVLAFVASSLGIPFGLGGRGPAGCSARPGQECRCSLAKRMSGTCCCSQPKSAAPTGGSCCASADAAPSKAPETAYLAEATCCSSGVKREIAAIPKSCCASPVKVATKSCCESSTADQDETPAVERQMAPAQRLPNASAPPRVASSPKKSRSLKVSSCPCGSDPGFQLWQPSPRALAPRLTLVVETRREELAAPALPLWADPLSPPPVPPPERLS